MKKIINNYFYSPDRNQVADLLKGFAVIFMIQVHITENFLIEKLHNESFGIISFLLGGTPAAPVFMFLMGFFISTNKEFLFYFERGVILFLIGILLNIGLNLSFLIHYFQNQIIGENPLDYILSVDILPFAGLSLIIIGLIKEAFGSRYYLYLILGLSLAIVSDFIAPLSNNLNMSLKYLLSFVYGISDWSYFPLIPWLFYPMIGFSFRLFSEKYKSNNKMFFIIIATIILILLAKKSFDQIIVLKKYYHHGFFLAIWNLSFMIIWTYIISVLEKYAGKTIILTFIKWLGKNVTTVYIIQWLIIGNLSIYLYDSLNQTQFFLCLIIVILATSLITFMVEKFKLINYSTDKK